MAQVRLSPGKKRYSVSLTEQRVTRFKSLCSHVGLPPTTLSALCDDAVHGMNEVLQEAKNKGSLRIDDIFHLLGKQVELLIEEERKDNADNEKRLASTDKQVLV
jgi:hypothetical protein